MDPGANEPASTSDLRGLPDGILFASQRGRRRILVRKEGAEVQLLFDSEESCEFQSRLNLDRPLDLLSAYTRAAMLFLLWRDAPRCVHVVGLGGGRIPAILAHHFPGAVIDCTETEPRVQEIAERFFGLSPGPRLRVFHQDGRSFLERRDEAPPYDAIIIDAFTGRGSGPPRLASASFFRACRRQLAAGGVLVLSILPGDPGTSRRIAAMTASFARVWLYQESDAVVALGYDGEDAGRDLLIRRARALQRRHRFAFPFVESARSLWPVRPPPEGPGPER